MAKEVCKVTKFDFRLTVQQKADLYEKAQRLGYDSAALFVLDAVRNKVKDYTIEYRLFKLINELSLEFSRTGNNINQIAKRLNQTKDLVPSSILMEELKAEFKQYNDNRKRLSEQLNSI